MTQPIHTRCEDEYRDGIVTTGGHQYALVRCPHFLDPLRYEPMTQGATDVLSGDAITDWQSWDGRGDE